MKRIIAAMALLFALITATAFAEYEETRTVRVGGNVVITLKAADPGFYWDVEEDPDARLALVGEPKIESGLETWTFNATGPGELKLTFNYMGPRAEDGPLETRVYHIIIIGADDTY
ncbi:MAG: protease inhibitor I42 family protein [Candidatus Omnitrophota bacterium]